ncbi:hypothetical protein [Marinicellulosiphila megalodicopiae]|uniref:hypothetical protein n=1 Tax=Marinicellulosiphila megalodicopiae TaxID=2724896 RepID=UPI003BB0868B
MPYLFLDVIGFYLVACPCCCLDVIGFYLVACPCCWFLTRLDLSETLFLNASLNINNSFANLIGKASSIDQHFSKFGLKRACGWVKSLSVLGL